MSARPVLAIVPAYVRHEQDLEVLLACLVTLAQTAPGIRTLVVDDGSPAAALMDQLEPVAPQVGAELVRKDENSGFAKTVNVGLREALATGADAVLVNADMEFDRPGWLPALRQRDDTQGRPAAVVGGLLLYPEGSIQHAGIFFSLLTRDWGHRFRYAPGDLPEAQVPVRCPVTAALQLIRHETLEDVGLYDEEYPLGWEDVDYCLRVFEAGLECIYEPAAQAIHVESVFRGEKTARVEEWNLRSLERLMNKWRHADLTEWVPPIA